MTRVERLKVERKIKALWKRHDRLERAILVEERKLTDKELRRIGAAAAA